VTRRHAVVAASVVVWIAVCFLPVVSLRAINIQDDIFTSDLLNDRLPARAFVGASIRRGELPLWSPDIYTGFPMFAQVEVAALYPSNLLLFGSLEPYVAIAYAQVLPLLLVGIGTGFLVLEYGLPWPTAVLAGGAMSMSGFFVCHIRQLNLIDAACWLPFLMILVERALRGSRRVAAATAAIWALSVLAGHPQVSYFTALVLAAYALIRCRQIDRGERARFLPWIASLPFDRRFGRLAVGAAIGTGIAGMQLLPAFELASLGHRRGGLSYEMAAAYPVSPKSLWSFFVPYANGDASDSTFALSGIFWEQFGYLGVFPVLFAIFAVVTERHDPRVRLLFGIAVVSALLMLGPNTPLFPLAFHFVPGMSYFRFPARFLLFVEIAVALLAAFGWAHVLREVRSKLGRFAVVFIVLAATGADLWLNQRRQVPLVEWRTWTKPIETVEVLREAAARVPLAPSRYLALDAKHLHSQVYHLSRGWAGDLSHFVAFRDYLQPSSNVMFGLPSVDGYANLVPHFYEQVWGSEKQRGLAVPSGRLRDGVWETAAHLPRLLALFDVRYVLSAWPLASPSFRRMGATKEGVQIYELPEARPRAFVVGRVRRVETDDEALRILRREDFAIADEALIHSADLELPSDAGSSRNVEIAERTGSTLALRSDTERPGLLVVSEAYYPGWRATVDGAEVPLHRANLMMRAVELPAGRHEIRLEFRPASVRIGAWISVAGLAALLVTGALERRSRDA
jgi:hypothetical protein